MAEETEKLVRIECDRLTETGWIPDDEWWTEKEVADYAHDVELEESFFKRVRREEARARLYRLAGGLMLTGLVAIAVFRTRRVTQL